MTDSLNNALNLLLNLDPQISFALSKLENKSLSIYITDLDIITTFTINNKKVTASNLKSSNIISGKLAYIMELLFNKNLQELLIDKKLDYQGSLSELKQFYSFFSSIDIDVIYYISTATNPIFANAIEVPFKKAKEFIQVSKNESIIDIKEYLTEEKKYLISKNEINIFYREVQKLKQATDRLEAKLRLLKGSAND
ncbi:ubiquinone biosynthesis accessory factor UbiJ [Francisella frigiditurris]|uniref:SCP-2 sterol transfer family protein n=1 Tax=Francisella frigiditurris TaxID=1542390 RepID=A0A1J0KSA2_9GAMM|nr:hypothetical protein [Francisella frigiditurris]APC96570.1 SCP-2 sterol transfer family protein [Francisella frigiditurris]